MLYKILIVIIGFLLRIIYRMDIQGLENIPDDNSGIIICSNHINFLDPVVISTVFPRQVRWMGKKELFDKKVLGSLLLKMGAFPVDREVGLAALRKSMKLLKNNEVLGIFPEGTRVDKIDYKNAKPGVALISIKTKTPIVPIYIESTYRPFSKLKLVVGKPFEFEEAYNTNVTSEDYKKHGEYVLYSIYELGK